MLKKLIASVSAAAVASTSLLSGLVMGAPVVTDPELLDAVSWAYDAGLTKYSDANAFMPYNNLTREQFAKFASEFASSQLDADADESKDCSFTDESSFDSTLSASIKLACQQGLMMGHNGAFMAKQLVTRGQVATVVSRMLGEIDALSSEQAHFDYLNSIGVMKVANLNSAILRGDALLMLYRLANGSDSDLCDIDPTLPGCSNNGTGGNTGTVVKEGDLQISMNPSTPANYTSIPNNGVSKYATVDFTAGTKDITLNSVTIKRSGLGSYSNFNGGRVYFEANGVRVSSRSNVSSDDIAVLSFVPALTVAAGKTVSVDLMAELSNAPTGAENKFTSTVIDSSAANVSGQIDTPTLRTAAYSVREVSFTNQNATTTYNGGETSVELGKFQLGNIGTDGTTKDVLVKAITLRNVGNGGAASSLTNLKLFRSGNAISTNTIVNGRDVTFVMSDTIKDGQTATYTINGTVVNVDNAAGDTYKFILRQASDLNASEASTSYRASVAIASGNANSTSATVNVYTVNGGELRFTRDTSLALSQNVTRGTNAVQFMKGSITAKQAILLENPTLAIANGSGVIAEVAKRYYLSIGNSTFSWTPSSGATSAQFDGSVTVNGTVPVSLYADIYSSASGSVNNVPVQFGPLSYTAFTASSMGTIEYVSTQNAVEASSAIGTIAGSSVSVIDASLSVTKYDGLGTVVYTSNNAQGKVFYGIRLSNNQANAIKVGAITLTPSNTAFNNGVSVNLKQGSTVIATRTLNGATTFNGLNVLVSKGTPVDLVFEGDFLSTIAGGTNGTFSVSFNTGDVLDNVTSNNVTVSGTPATSATVNVITGGSVIASSNTVSTAQGFMVAGAEKKVGSINLQAINDQLELRGLYVKIIGSGAFAANAGNQLTNFKIVDGSTVIATESSRDTQTNTNDIVKFTSFTSTPAINAGSSKVFDIYATANTVNDANDAGEFNVVLATTYNDADYSDEYLGTRLYSVNAGTYVSASSSPTANITTSALGNVLNVVAGYPNVSKVADGNATDLVTIKITNPGSTNITVDALQYFANAQTASDIAKPATIYNGSTIVAQTTLVANANTPVTFTAPITIAGGDSVTLRVALDSPFVNTSATPVAGNRVFQISNVEYSQTFANGSTSAFGFVPAGYTNTVGLPVAAANY